MLVSCVYRKREVFKFRMFPGIRLEDLLPADMRAVAEYLVTVNTVVLNTCGGLRSIMQSNQNYFGERIDIAVGSGFAGKENDLAERKRFSVQTVTYFQVKKM